MRPIDPAFEPRLQAVAEPMRLTEWTPPWPMARYAPGEWIVLSGDSRPDEVGAVMAQLARYDMLPDESADEALERLGRLTAPELLRRLADAADEVALGLYGGIRAVGGGDAVEPGCCSGLEGWREWWDMLGEDWSPWMGHDPWGWVEQRPDGIRVCSGPHADSSAPNGGAEHAVFIPADRVVPLLERVEADLNGFLDRVRDWAVALDPAQGERVAATFDRAFQVRAPRAPSPAESDRPDGTA